MNKKYTIIQSGTVIGDAEIEEEKGDWVLLKFDEYLRMTINKNHIQMIEVEDDKNN
jgi:hypothetical protein